MLFAALMTACGGGGGSAGTVPGVIVTPPKPTIVVDIVNGAGVGTSTVGSGTTTFARAQVSTAAGAKVPNTVVTFTVPSGLAIFSPLAGTALTDANGIATIQILPASTTGGAGVLNADATVSDVAATQGAVSFQVLSSVPDAPTARVSNFVLLLDKSTLSNAGTATAKLTVVAVDANNNVVPGAAVSVATDANTIFTPNASATNSSGRYTGEISAGNDKSDRTVVATVTINGIVRQTSLQIIGSAISINMTPTILNPGGASTVTALVTDGALGPIGNTSVTFSGDIAQLMNRNVVTDAAGRATVGFVAPAVAGSYLVKATASGVSNQISVQVGSSAAIPPAVIPNGAQAALAAIPNVVAPNAAGSTSSQSQLRFLFLDGTNKPIPNVRVRFNIQSVGLGSSDSAISTGTTTVYTNASGVATAAFIPGPTGSPTDGVQVRACYQANDFANTAQCPSSVVVNLTIAAQPLAVSIGNDNLLQAGTGGTYIKTFVVTVADAAGRAVKGAPVDISLDITHYGKGLFEQASSFPLAISDANRYVPNAATDPETFEARVSCINEDFNRNGFADTSVIVPWSSVRQNENVNGSTDSFGQPTLEPRRSDIILSYKDAEVQTTNDSGVLLIQVEYSQRFATWLSYRIRATTSVSGSQGSAERAFVTSYIIEDGPTGSFRTPPYGVRACNNPN
ncbi:hypothetical protein [Ramlibacter sp. WS9]|uniref:hypothetical protein n=1 Tax=Ramlibacter sp. WS9 TaxID=1882741 RepID=UPI0013054043|nr:hypothetical protein [Ramlibacter sp. WS9]